MTQTAIDKLFRLLSGPLYITGRAINTFDVLIEILEALGDSEHAYFLAKVGAFNYVGYKIDKTAHIGCRPHPEFGVN